MRNTFVSACYTHLAIKHVIDLASKAQMKTVHKSSERVELLFIGDSVIMHVINLASKA